MVRRQLAHQKLEVALALDATGFQKILHQLEHGDDVSALLGMVFVGRQELSQHQDDRGEQTFGGIVEEGVLPTVAVIAVRVDNGLGQDLGVFFCFCAGRQIPRLLSGDIHVPVDQRQQIVAIRAGGITQVDNRDIVPIALLGDGSVIPGKVALAVQRQPAHAAGTGIFQIGIEEIGCLADAGSADHEAVDIVAVHQSGKLALLALAPQHQPLLRGAVVAAAPFLHLEGDMGIGLPDLFGCGPSCGAVLAVADRFGFDPAQGIVVGQGGQTADDQKHQPAGGQQNQDLVWHG